MRIAMLLSTPLPPAEGIGFYAWNLSRYLVSNGHQVHLITRGGPRCQPAQQVDGITIHRPPFLPCYPFHVWLHGLFVNQLLARLAPRIDVLHFHTPLVPPPCGKLPLLVTVHTPILADTAAAQARNLYSLLTKAQTPFSLATEKQLIARADRLVAVASSVASELAAYGIDPGSIGVLGNGADTGLFSPGPRPVGLPTYILTAGRLGLRKGFEDLIACALIVKQSGSAIQFWIAGDGPLKSQLQDKINALGLSSTVRLLGHITSRDQLVKLYRGAALYVHPAHYEGLATVMLEAMSCGTPVVSTAVSGALDVIQDRVNGRLVPSRNPAALASAILELLAEPNRTAGYGIAARQTILERYSWEVVGAHYLAEYERLLGRGVNA